MSMESIIKAYDLLENSSLYWDSWEPNDYSILKDVCDIHIHANPGRIDALGCAKDACRAGMRAIVFKGVMSPSVHVAAVCEEAVREWAQEKGLPPIRVFGGLVLDKMFWLDMTLVKAMIRWGAKKIWMPVFTAANHKKMKGMSRKQARKEGIYILKNGELLPEVAELLTVIAEADIALSCGHLSAEEDLILIDRARSAGIKKIIIDHPHADIIGPITFEQQTEMAKKGAYLNIVINPGWWGYDPFVIVEQIKAIGAEHCILSTDVGHAWQATPIEMMRSNIKLLEFCGLDKEALDIMTKKNPAYILGLLD